jgi:hypothetical protein
MAAVVAVAMSSWQALPVRVAGTVAVAAVAMSSWQARLAQVVGTAAAAAEATRPSQKPSGGPS